MTAMNEKDFRQVVRENNLRLQDNIAYGQRDGFPFMAFLQKNWLSNELCIVWNINATDNKRIIKELKALVKKYNCRAGCKKDLLAVWLSEETGNLSLKFKTVLKLVLDFFKTHQIAPVDKCPVCGKGACDSAMCVNFCYRKVHKSCAKQKYPHSKKKKAFEYGGVFWRFLGAFLGGIVVFAVELFAAVNGYHVLFGLNIGCFLFAMLGYKIGGGMSRREMMSLSWNVTFFFSFLLPFVMRTYGIEIYRGASFSLLFLWILCTPFIFDSAYEYYPMGADTDTLISLRELDEPGENAPEALEQKGI